MCFSERMTASNQSQRFLVVHRHVAKGATDIGSGRKRVVIAVGSFRIDVDKSHLRSSERAFQIALPVAAVVGQHLGFRTPEHEIRLPCVNTAAGKPDGLETHVLERDVTRQHHQIAPGQLATVFLLDRPDQAARLVETDIVGP